MLALATIRLLLLLLTAVKKVELGDSAMVLDELLHFLLVEVLLET